MSLGLYLAINGDNSSLHFIANFGAKKLVLLLDCGVSGEGCLGAGFLFVTIGGGTFGFVH